MDSIKLVKNMSRRMMMKQILKIEISRAFRTKGMLFSLIGGCVLSVLHIIQYQIPAHQTLLQRAFETAPIGLLRMWRAHG
mgnify:CR=1 FL=1